MMFQFWKFIKDTKMYLKLSMPTADSVICKYTETLDFLLTYVKLGKRK